MKKVLYLLLACVLCSALIFTACSKESKEQTDEATEAEVTQEQIEKDIIGTWIKSEADGQPVPTNEKSVYNIVSTTEAYTSVSRNVDDGTLFNSNQKSEVVIDGNVVTITTTNSEGESFIHEFTITNISADEFTADKKFTHTLKGTDPLVNEYNATFVKVSDDYSKDIFGTWEGRCTSEGSVFDDGQDHRWEYKDDGTFVYYVKDGENWVPSADEMNEYFVAGNLLCTRWTENGEENREWWEISIDGDKMKWTALREGEDGKTFTASFEMTKVQE
jgi:archaellum component FlaG (FlaF/FlaG flagellin family)